MKLEQEIELTLREFIPYNSTYCIPDLKKVLAKLFRQRIDEKQIKEAMKPVLRKRFGSTVWSLDDDLAEAIAKELKGER